MTSARIMENQNEENRGNTNNCSDFSIEHILHRAGNNSRKSEMKSENSVDVNTFSWLNCTRYCPPKVPRVQRREGPQKRQLGRHPRIPFTSHQLSVLEEKFQQSPYLSSEEVINLSQKLQLADIRVKIWFQNRRARERREKSTEIHPPTSELRTSEVQIVIKQENASSTPPQQSNSADSYHFLPQTLIPSYNFTNFLVPVSSSYSQFRVIDQNSLSPPGEVARN